MKLLYCIATFTMAIGCMVSSSSESKLINSNLSASMNLANNLPDNLPEIRGFNIPMTVKLVPYEVTAQNGTNYAEISLNISNTSRRDVEVQISQVTVLAGGENYVLLSATPQELGLSSKISIQPGDVKVLNYRLKSESKRYQRGQKVVALIYYQQDGHLTGIAVSNSEQVSVYKLERD